jgi:hypothetical protein
VVSFLQVSSPKPWRKIRNNEKKKKLGSAGCAPSLRVIPWHLHYNWGKTMVKPQVRVVVKCPDILVAIIHYITHSFPVSWTTIRGYETGQSHCLLTTAKQHYAIFYFLTPWVQRLFLVTLAAYHKAQHSVHSTSSSENSTRSHNKNRLKSGTES